MASYTNFRPEYSVYADARNGYFFGFHKLKIPKGNLDSQTTIDTYQIDVPRLGNGFFSGAQLGLENQSLNLVTVKAAGANPDRDIANVQFSTSVRATYPRNTDGTIDIIVTTIHKGVVNNSNRT